MSRWTKRLTASFTGVVGMCGIVRVEESQSDGGEDQGGEGSEIFCWV